jgi:hypothetical protein
VEELSNLLAAKFIARRDVKAVQRNSGIYEPDREPAPPGAVGVNRPWRREDLNAHLAGTQTFGHYVLDVDSTVKMFCFDLDLRKNTVDAEGNPVFTGSWWQHPPLDREYTAEEWVAAGQTVSEDIVKAWRTKGHPARKFLLAGLREEAHRLARGITELLEIPTAVAYSGSKGLHVYGFTGRIPAAEARVAANAVIEHLGRWTPERGKHFFGNTITDLTEPQRNICLEVFPKQDTLSSPDSFGNLIRLPLGVNRKSGHKGFFVDLRSPWGTLAERNPVEALTVSDQWADE